ncbi:hypothetical protein VF14_17190 [Nostoc linckia z18]|uniref:DUF3370 domain-containing protein n=2 Tax=Nostoc linckia TaxID=92942 RepID=A0A9Q6EKU4_NOSLI|nr:DUF3370 domain-containing protein [Nostoc linckia]PHK40734.1 hypothetical protein VF12_09155 [Nostoc linckia z15]PHK46159.1 hypothetical protein VF13_12535 [Nostoc linckia z16]PHJ59733.1 hypothetical protein VF02_24285 [Nostoc linckia z1]PHJ63201.1 hypothetical protein VF05_25460 [Nostoc linckia z3]PHJ70048.1 hypothetical protein VF03_22835 [Nostoc linckia z2]
MLPFLLSFSIAQSTPVTAPPQEVVQSQQVRPLPGKLDTVPTFNSNSPELVLKEGILLSTFPPKDKKVPTAHLNFPFRGRFDIFAHHVARAEPPENLRSLYLGIILHNPTSQPVKVNILQAASYLSQPDAPFIELPSFTQNPLGKIFAGPGDRVMTDILRGQRQNIFPAQIEIPPGQSRMLLNLPIPVQGLTPPLNGRSTLMRLQSSNTVYAASLAMFAPTNADGGERAPTLEEWENLLNNGDLASPRDKTPTPLEETDKPIIYGRVAGVVAGTQWRALLVDNPKARYLTIPQPGQMFSYALSTLDRGTLGTNQIQSGKMLVRYPDTAYRAHGNYGIQYSLKLPLYNNTQSPQTVSVSIQTPLKEDRLVQPGLRFLSTPARQVFFRGTVRVRYKNEQNQPKTEFVHLVQKRGQIGEPLVSLNMKPGDRSLVEVDFLYPPDATPPQVLTVSTQGGNR